MTTALFTSENELTQSKNKVSFDIERKIDSLTSDSLPYYNSVFKELYLANRLNAQILCDFIVAEINNQNIKTSTKLTHIKLLCWFSKYLNYKNFQLITRDDVMDYLNSLRQNR
jgi:poly(3-hydroxyalkanoate) synthetase